MLSSFRPTSYIPEKILRGKIFAVAEVEGLYNDGFILR